MLRNSCCPPGKLNWTTYTNNTNNRLNKWGKK